jgi:hypothetical protein
MEATRNVLVPRKASSMAGTSPGMEAQAVHAGVQLDVDGAASGTCGSKIHGGLQRTQVVHLGLQAIAVQRLHRHRLGVHHQYGSADAVLRSSMPSSA